MGAPANPTATGSNAPASQYQTVTPGTPLGAPCRSLFVGGAGDVVVRSADGTNVTFTAPAGAILPIITSLVVSATATAIIALY